MWPKTHYINVKVSRNSHNEIPESSMCFQQAQNKIGNSHLSLHFLGHKNDEKLFLIYYDFILRYSTQIDIK